MNWFGKLRALWSSPAGAAPQKTATGPTPMVGPGAASVSLSGRPSYAPGYGSRQPLARDASQRLYAQYRASVPAIKRSMEILAGFVGVPELLVEDDEATTADLKKWLENVPYGDGVGGFSSWLSDLIDQSLTYGYAAGESEIAPDRKGVSALWTYLSPTIYFRADANGRLETVQCSTKGELTLNPEMAVRVTHGAKACSPQGESLLLTLPTFCQSLADLLYAHRNTVRRCGTPTYHIHTQLPKELDDPEGAIAAEVNAEVESAWNEAMKSKVVDGVVKDFFTANVGETTVKAIGTDGQEMDLEVPHRVIVEEIVAATGIPPFMFGFSWSTTERMSRQQADMLMQTIDCIRREVTSAVRKVAALHLQLSGKQVEFKVVWPDVSLQDLEATARAAFMDAQADEIRRKFWFEMWRAGFVDQKGAAEKLLGSEDVVTPMDEPPSAGPAPQPAVTPEGVERAFAELEAEYPWLSTGCGGH